MFTAFYFLTRKAPELALRRYLLGHDKLPDDIGFMVQVDVGRPGLRVMHPPTCTEAWDQFGYCSRHAFVIPCLRFHMSVGGLLKYHRATDDLFQGYRIDVTQRKLTSDIGTPAS